MFEKYGKISSVKIMKSEEGKSKGLGRQNSLLRPRAEKGRTPSRIKEKIRCIETR